MVGMMQIMIWMLYVYLVFKGIEIFQIAHVRHDGLSRLTRGPGVILGVVMIVVAVLAAIGFFVMEESMALSLSHQQQNIPNLLR